MSRNHLIAARLEDLADAAEKLARLKNRTDLVGEIYEECCHRSKTYGSNYPAAQLARFALLTVLAAERKASQAERTGILDVYADDHHAVSAKLPEHFVAPNYMEPEAVQQARTDARRIDWQRDQKRKRKRKGIVDTPDEGKRYNGARTAYRDGRTVEHFQHSHIYAVHSWSSRQGNLIEYAL